MEENKQDQEQDKEPIRGPVTPTEDDPKDADGNKIDYRRVPKEDRPDLSAHRDEIMKRLQDGHSMRAIHRDLNVSRWMLRDFIFADEDLKRALEDAKEDYLDLQEEIINDIAMLDCSMVETEMGFFPRYDGRSLSSKFNAAKLRLERLGASRGWNAKLETNEVGNGAGRVPVILCGDISEETLAECDEQVKRANEEAMNGLEGIPHG